jgi:hypothetical protein
LMRIKFIREQECIERICIATGRSGTPDSS